MQARVPVDPGKQSSRRELNALGDGMIFLQDDESKQQFMVDTSAVCSILPHRSKAKPTGPPLSGADGKDIPCWGRIRRRRLAQPPYMGDAWHQSLIQGGQRVFTGGGRIRLITDPARPIHQHRRVAVAFFPQRPTDHHGRPPATADAAQLSASSINTTGGAAAGPLRAGPPGRCTAAAVPGLRWTLPSAGAVNTFLSPRDGRENQQGAHTPPQGSPDTGRY